MTASRILLTTVQVILPESLLEEPKTLANSLSHSSLHWRQSVLWVKHTQESKSQVPALQSESWLRDCLKNSKVKLVSLDPDLGSSNLKVWADACEQANKIVLLQTPISQDIVQRQISPQWQLWCMINWCVSATLLLMLMPTMAVLGVLIKLSSPGSVFHSHWSVGQRGKLFKLIQFRTTNSKNSNSYPFGQWLRQSGLDKLPQLINVLRGEMNLFGTHPYSLDEAASLDQKQRYQLRALPGVIGYWGTVNHSKAMDITPIV